MEVVKFSTPVLLIGGGDVEWTILFALIEQGYPLIAVDGGANRLKQNEIVPDLIIGDLDSLAERQYWETRTTVTEISEQSSTDFEKALYSTEAPLYLAFGFIGKRFDHSLSALHILIKYNATKQVILVDCVDLMFLATGISEFPLPKDTRLSIYPVSPVTFKSSTGLLYPLDGLIMEQGTFIGTSNITNSENVQIIPQNSISDHYLLILPNLHLDQITSACLA